MKLTKPFICILLVPLFVSLTFNSFSFPSRMEVEMPNVVLWAWGCTWMFAWLYFHMITRWDSYNNCGLLPRGRQCHKYLCGISCSFMPAAVRESLKSLREQALGAWCMYINMFWVLCFWSNDGFEVRCGEVWSFRIYPTPVISW